ncbi:MAG TPA: crossover junction endodeoxyribonuclease RuvC [Polyangiaceae bacterium]|jgi:crossover junction endodeoxyribonuclease RuvC|nr:crossover junction endodeoxyribonuclease RuvC [Polyangiaceae bacterium]
MTIVLGLDPGTRHFGWGVVERRGSRLVHLAHGVVDVDEHATIAARLVVIEQALVQVLEAHSPAAASVEALFYAKDPQAAAKLGHARGVGLLVCARAGVDVHEYAPALVKQAVTGSGRAEKGQVAQMVRIVLGLPHPPRSDAADALAAAITHLQRAPWLVQAQERQQERQKAKRVKGL